MKKQDSQETKALKAKPAKAKVEKAGTAEKKTSKAKKEKKTKKAPGVFAKKYRSAVIDKKIFDRIQVQQDKEFVKGLFVLEKDSKEREIYLIPKDKRFDKKDYLRLKRLSADIKSQKGRVKLGALLVTVALVAAAVIGFMLTKNLLVKMAVEAGCETVFGAECDVGAVDFRPFDGYLKVSSLQIADKDSPWTNLVDIADIICDFDLTLLLQGKFIVEEMDVTGIQAGTRRTTDGTLVPKEKEAARQKEAGQAPETTEPSSLMVKLNAEKDALYARLTASFTELFCQYDPATVLDELYAQLKTPGLADSSIAYVNGLTATWQDKTTDLVTVADGVKKDVEAVLAIDLSVLKTDPLRAKDMYDTVMKAYNASVAAYGQAEQTVSDAQAAYAEVSRKAEEISAAIAHDTDFARQQVENLKGVTLQDGFAFMTETGEKIAYDVLGDLYGYIKKAVEFLASREKTEKTADAKKKPGARAAGRTLSYGTLDVPAVWIKHLEGSGPRLHLVATDISSDEEKAGAPAAVSLTGTGFQFAVGDSASGGLGLASDIAFALETEIHSSGSFTAVGTVDFAPFSMNAGSFEPVMASQVVNQALSGFNGFKAAVTAECGDGKDLSVQFTTDAPDLLFAAVRNAFNAQLAAIKEAAIAEVRTKLESYAGGVLQSVTGFSDTQSLVQEYTGKIAEYTDQIEQKKNEVSGIVTGAQEQAEAALKEAERQAREAAAKAQAEAERLAQEAAAKAWAEAEEAAAKARAEAEEAAAKARAEAERQAQGAAAQTQAEAERAAREAAEQAASKAADVFKGFF